MGTLNKMWYGKMSRAFVAATLLLFSGQTLAQVTEAFRVVHASDTHVGADSGPGSHAHTNIEMYREMSGLTPLPRVVLQTGDIVEIGTDAQYAVYKSTLEALSVPNFDAPGNHDVRWNPLGKEGYTRGVAQPRYQAKTVGGVRFVMLDSTVLLQHWGHIDQEQLRWLREDLSAQPAGMPVVIGFHHWIGRDRVQVDNEAELIQIARDFNVVLWLQGHGHSDIQWWVDGVPAIMTKGLYQGSYNVLDFKPDRLTITRRTLGKPQESKEILRDKSKPTDTNIFWTEVFDLPLQRPTRPQWTATADVQSGASGEGILLAVKGPSDAQKLQWRINNGPYADVQTESGLGSALSSAEGTRVVISTQGLIPGRQQITVQLTTQDGRAYHESVEVDYHPSGSTKPIWQTQLPGAVQSTLVSVDSLGSRPAMLLASTMGGTLHAINPESGKQMWSFSAKDSIFATPLVVQSSSVNAEGLIIVPSSDHHVYALNPATGQLIWQSKLGGAAFASASYANGVVCAAAVDQKVYGLDVATGKIIWTAPVGGMVQSRITTDGQHFYLAGWDNHVRALNVTSGTEIWSRKLGANFYFSPAISSPVLAGDLLLATSNDGVMHALKRDDGQTAWTFDNKKLAYSTPAYVAASEQTGQAAVYTAIGDAGQVFRLDAVSGQRQWTADTGHVIYDSSAVVADSAQGKRVFIGSVAGVFSSLDAQTGQVIWQYRLGQGHLLASPAADAKRVFIANQAGDVVAFEIR